MTRPLGILCSWLRVLSYGAMIGCVACRGTQGHGPGPEPSVSAQPAAPQSQTIERPGYTLQYPGNWKLDDQAESFDLDHYFNIDGPDSCHVTIAFFPPTLTEKACVETQTEAFTQRMFKEAPTQTPYSTWGTLRGSGLELHGKIKPLGTGRIRNFAHTDDKRTLFVGEFCFDEDLPAAQPGFDSIARSFRLRG